MGNKQKREDKIARIYYSRNPHIMLQNELGLKANRFERFLLKLTCARILRRNAKKPAKKEMKK